MQYLSYVVSGGVLSITYFENQKGKKKDSKMIHVFFACQEILAVAVWYFYFLAWELRIQLIYVYKYQLT